MLLTNDQRVLRLRDSGITPSDNEQSEASLCLAPQCELARLALVIVTELVLSSYRHQLAIASSLKHRSARPQPSMVSVWYLATVESKVRQGKVT